MTRYLAAVLVAAGGTVKAGIDPRTKFAAALGPSRPAAMLAKAHRDGRAKRAAGVKIIAAAGHRIRLEDRQQGGPPC